jgi:RHS repeat-associated protein
VTGSDFVYVHADQLDTPRLATNASGTVVWRWDSDAFSLGAANQDPDGDTNLVNIRLRFPGQYLDEETGLHYNYFRDYDAVTGRYIQSDPIGLTGGVNTYGYGYDNPLRYVDPLGLRFVDVNPGIEGAGISKADLIAAVIAQINCNPDLRDWFEGMLAMKGRTLDDLFYGDLDVRYGVYPHSWWQDVFTTGPGKTRWDGVFSGAPWPGQPDQSIAISSRALSHSWTRTDGTDLFNATRLFVHELSHWVEALSTGAFIPAPPGFYDHGAYIESMCDRGCQP